MRRPTKRAAVVLTVLLLNVGFALLYLRGIADLWATFSRTTGLGYQKFTPPPGMNPHDKTVVVGKLANQDTDWIARFLPDWQAAIYTVDDLSAPLHTDVNKGHESMVYLTYLIDNYDQLPMTIAFIHSHYKGWWTAWHTDAPHYDNAISLNSLNLNFVQKNGYVNLRCAWKPGCRSADRTNAHVTPEIWQYMFGNETLAPEMPQQIAAPCCAQFAVSREQVLKRRKEEYIRYREWIYGTNLDDAKSGRVLEFLWHVIFGQEAVYCPDADVCYCEVYGRC